MMTKFIWKFLSLTCICAVFMVIGATDTFAYLTYEVQKDAGGNCSTCHPEFLGGFGSAAHELHTALTGCSSCHVSNGDNPSVSLNPSDASGTGCAGCHGRLEDAGNDTNPYPGLGAGLRQHHYDAAITGCVGCHVDSNPANYTPVGEHVIPPFYPALALDPCEDSLDNDGDGAPDVCDANMIYGTISGAIQAGVTVDIYILNCGLSDTNVGSPVTNAAGYYELGGLAIGQYDVYPNETNFSFAPGSFWAYIPNSTGQSYDSTSTAD
jgi:hypothetical protein